MKSLWKDYLQIPAEGHITDQVFFTHLAIHICMMRIRIKHKAQHRKGAALCVFLTISNHYFS